MSGKAKSTQHPAPAPGAEPSLRQLAEAALHGQSLRMPEPLTDLSVAQTQRMLHELGVHQIELEMQNEELRRAQADLIVARTRYVDLYDLAPVGYFTLGEDGLIRQANLTAASLLGVARSALINQRLTAFIFAQDQDVYYLYRRNHIRVGEPQSCELRMVKPDGSPFWVHLETTAALDADGVPEFRTVLNDVSERMKTQTALRESMAQSHRLSRRVLEAQETERRRVAMELHDELGQALTAIKINLQVGERFQDSSPGQLNAENIRIVDEALQQVRRIAHTLRPSVLDDLGLAPALRWLAEQTAARSGLAVHVDPVVPSLRLAPEIEIACFRIAQEALTNIVRHAQAQHVELSLHSEADAVVLSVQDDGHGFDLAAMRARAVAGGSLGLLGMQERAMLIGGQLEIESALGRGCTVRLRCPSHLRTEPS